jgi:hypothetical protein
MSLDAFPPSLDIRSARERILQYLRLRAGVHGGRIAIEGQLQEIAAEIGITREARYWDACGA